MKTNHKNYIKLAFNLAKQNLGKTNLNPSVGCVVVKNNAVISSGVTSKSGRPHAEFNALNKKINFSKLLPLIFLFMIFKSGYYKIA